MFVNICKTKEKRNTGLITPVLLFLFQTCDIFLFYIFFFLLEAQLGTIASLSYQTCTKALKIVFII